MATLSAWLFRHCNQQGFADQFYKILLIILTFFFLFGTLHLERLMVNKFNFNLRIYRCYMFK